MRQASTTIIVSKSHKRQDLPNHRVIHKQPHYKHTKQISFNKKPKIPETDDTDDDKQNAFRVLMVKRSSSTGWMKNLYVFPGGSVDITDIISTSNLNQYYNKNISIPTWESNKTDIFPQKISQTSQYLCNNNHHQIINALTYRTAALREAFEEANLLTYPLDISLSVKSPLSSISYEDISRIYQSVCLNIDALIDNKKTHKNLKNTSLNIKLHELTRRVVHYNDQNIINMIVHLLNNSLEQHIKNTDIETISKNEKINNDTQHKQTDIMNSTCNSTATSQLSYNFLDIWNSIIDNAITSQSIQNNKKFLFNSIYPIAKWITPLLEKKSDKELINSYSSVDNLTIDEKLDLITLYFNKISLTTNITQCDDISSHTSALDEPTNKLYNQLLSATKASTLSQEISDCRWIDPTIFIQQAVPCPSPLFAHQLFQTQCNNVYNLGQTALQKMDKTIFLAPPTQFLLSQLHGFSYQSLECVMSEIYCQNNNKIINDFKIPNLPERTFGFSKDPYTYATTIIKHAVNIYDNQKNVQLDKKNFIFGETMPSMPFKTKGSAILLGDLDHPLTQQLLLHFIGLLEKKTTEELCIDQSRFINTFLIPKQSKTINQKEILPIETNKSLFEQYTAENYIKSHDLCTSITCIDDMEQILINNIKPLLPLSNVSLYPSPIELLEQNNDFLDIFQWNSHPIISKYFSLPLELKQKILPYIHYLRITDSLVHDNWEIVTSNQNCVGFLRKDLGLPDCIPKDIMEKLLHQPEVAINNILNKNAKL